MEKTKKTAKVFLVISILLMFVSAIVASAVQTNGGKVRMEELNIMTDEGYTMSAYLFVPENATKDTPAPAIVTSHGYLNNKEMTDANYVELARRGYVVLAIDQPDHGDSEVTEDFFILAPTGVYQGVLALSRMPFVDKGKIGVTGHSMGSWSVNDAVHFFSIDVFCIESIGFASFLTGRICSKIKEGRCICRFHIIRRL